MIHFRPRKTEGPSKISERKVQTCSDFLSQAGKLDMVNSVLSSKPTFYLSSLKIRKYIIDQIDKYRRHCLWKKSEISQNTMDGWHLICKQKYKGEQGGH